MEILGPPLLWAEAMRRSDAQNELYTSSLNMLNDFIELARSSCEKRGLKPLFHFPLFSTARTFIQSQYLKALAAILRVGGLKM